MSSQRAASWGYAEEFVPEPEVVERARVRGEQLGCTPVGPGTGPALQLLTAATRAKAARVSRSPNTSTSRDTNGASWAVCRS